MRALFKKHGKNLLPPFVFGNARRTDCLSIGTMQNKTILI